MRLVTQNLLTCQVKACMDTAATPDGGFLSYPLKVVPDAGGLKQVASPFDEGVAKSILPRLDWAALRKTAAELGVAALPEEVPAGAESDAGFLRSVYALVFDIHLEEGNLLCPHCGRAFPVRKGVPNMLLRDDEM